ncbi:MAG: CoA transferase, partial [Acidimicrobiia bacterium]|nr:CoA transferase [Acidimicrobiia bacterium]
LVLDMAVTADVLLEGFRPGVAERLGVGPGDMAGANDSLVYGRMTGWGQDGPMAPMAGHDINYIGLVGVLGAIGSESPVPPLNLVGDYGGGAMYLLVGVLAALVERSTSGRGQVVDAAMADGAASLMTPIYQLKAAGYWRDERNTNLLDGAAPFYRTYETADGEFMAVGALEPQFYARLLDLLGLDVADRPHQMDRAGWPQLEADIAAAFAAQSRNHWESVFSGEDACVTPVLSLGEAPAHAQNQARKTFMTRTGNPEPAPAPRFSRSAGEVPRPAPAIGSDTRQVLGAAGVEAADIESLLAAGVVGEAS